jgi:hypothetical protein
MRETVEATVEISNMDNMQQERIDNIQRQMGGETPGGFSIGLIISAGEDTAILYFSGTILRLKRLSWSHLMKI